MPLTSVNEAPLWVWKGTIPSLNGLRAFAILSVIASHYNRDFAGSWTIGHFGVTTFFVISGFLITLLLLRERTRMGSISLKGFYTRRALRILPAYLVFLGVIALLQQIGIYNPSTLSWITALTYTSCFFTLSIDPHIAHSWSLSVEEHFYILWPLLFNGIRSKATIAVLLALIAVSPLLRWIFYHSGIPALDINYSSPAQMGSISIGCLLAFIVVGEFLPRANTLFRSRPLAVISAGALLIALSVLTLRSNKALHEVLADPVRAIGFGLLMMGVLHLRAGNWLTRLLNNAVFNAIGILSYSLYLWQQIFARDYDRMPGGIPGSLLWLSIVAAASYFLIESPFLKMKAKIRHGEVPPQPYTLGA